MREKSNETISEEKEELNSDSKKKLNICCGSLLLEGYDNSDLHPINSTVMEFDHSKTWPVKSESYDEVYARHCIEHFSKDEATFLVGEIYRVLRPGGMVYITCPNLGYIRWDMNDPDPRKRDILMAFYFGYQTKSFDSRCDSHKWGYTWETLGHLLIDIGFWKVKNLTNNPISREFQAKRWFGGIITEGNTAHHLEVIGVKRLGER